MNCIRIVFSLLALTLAAFSQSAEITIENPPPPRFVGPILKPFHIERRVVSPANLTNTPRLESLVRAGNLYLSVRDVIALTLENNLDIAIQRYGPYMAREVLRRADGGGLLRSDINTDIIAGPQSVSTAGVSSSGSGLATGAGVGGRIRHRIRADSSESGPDDRCAGDPGSLHHARDQHHRGGNFGAGADIEAD
jgi:hypothetical protein